MGDNRAARFCTNCGALRVAENAFCTECGAQLHTNINPSAGNSSSEMPISSRRSDPNLEVPDPTTWVKNDTRKEWEGVYNRCAEYFNVWLHSWVHEFSIDTTRKPELHILQEGPSSGLPDGKIAFISQKFRGNGRVIDNIPSESPGFRLIEVQNLGYVLGTERNYRKYYQNETREADSRLMAEPNNIVSYREGTFFPQNLRDLPDFFERLLSVTVQCPRCEAFHQRKFGSNRSYDGGRDAEQNCPACDGFGQWMFLIDSKIVSLTESDLAAHPRMYKLFTKNQRGANGLYANKGSPPSSSLGCGVFAVMGLIWGIIQILNMK